MASLKLKLKVKVAWWVRSALVVAVVLARIRPAWADWCIDAIVDRGIATEPE
jgi:hypothetical protein